MNGTDRTGVAKNGFPIVLLILRLFLGGEVFEAGLGKLISGSFSATGYLSNGTGPFAPLFADLTTDIAVLNYVVMWGELLVGIAVILGVFLRFASFWGCVMMLTYYLPYLPPANGWIAQQIVYLIVFVLFMVSGAGYFLGLDYFGRRLEERKHPARYVLG